MATTMFACEFLQECVRNPQELIPLLNRFSNGRIISINPTSLKQQQILICSTEFQALERNLIWVIDYVSKEGTSASLRDQRQLICGAQQCLPQVLKKLNENAASIGGGIGLKDTLAAAKAGSLALIFYHPPSGAIATAVSFLADAAVDMSEKLGWRESESKKREKRAPLVNDVRGETTTLERTNILLIADQLRKIDQMIKEQDKAKG